MTARLREEVLSHLWKRYPQHCMILTDPRARHAIDVGIARADHHGFRDLPQVRPYVSLMVFLGSHFDEDPQLSWAGERLRQRSRASRADAMADLLREATKRMEPIVGRQGEYYRRALAWAESRDVDSIVAQDASDDGLRIFLRQLHRRKHDALGDDAIGALIQLARNSAARHGLTTPPGTVVYLALMFLLGSAFDQDPFHPWAGETLAATATTEPTARALELHRKAIETLRRYTRLDTLMRANTSRG